MGVRISMVAVCNPYQNAFAESFMKTLKIEEVNLNDYQTLEKARANIEYFFHNVYNGQRLHSDLAYRSPNEFKQMYYQGLLS